MGKAYPASDSAQPVSARDRHDFHVPFMYGIKDDPDLLWRWPNFLYTGKSSFVHKNVIYNAQTSAEFLEVLTFLACVKHFNQECPPKAIVHRPIREGQQRIRKTAPKNNSQDEDRVNKTSSRVLLLLNLFS